jgi:hypothetical protein
MSNGRRFLCRVPLALVAVLLGACSQGDDPGASSPTDFVESVGAASIKPGDPIPAPVGEVVLTVDGAIDNTNEGEPVEFDMATLRQVGLKEYVATDNAGGSDKDVRFTGILLSDLLAVVGAAKDATDVHAAALNDYSIDIPISDSEKMPVLLAIEADGEEMSVEKFGPIRVVYPNKEYELDFQANEANWIWQLATITVK